MKKFLILIAVFGVSGCAPYWYVPIEPPPGPSTIVVQPVEPSRVVQPEKPTVVPPSAEGQPPAAPVPPPIEVWRPDPTAGIIQNYSRNIFVRGWIDSRPPAPPTFELEPEQAVPVYVPLGSHTLFAEGWIITPTYGRTSVGTTSRTFDIRNWSYLYGGYAWRLYINDGDFGR